MLRGIDPDGPIEHKIHDILFHLRSRFAGVLSAVEMPGKAPTADARSDSTDQVDALLRENGAALRTDGRRVAHFVRLLAFASSVPPSTASTRSVRMNSPTSSSTGSRSHPLSRNRTTDHAPSTAPALPSPAPSTACLGHVLSTAAVDRVPTPPDLNTGIIENGVATGDPAYVLGTAALMLGITVLQMVSSVTAVSFGARTAMGIGRDLRAAVFRHVGGFSEREVNSLRADRTSFVIAHRLSTIGKADRIPVMEAGNIVEQGMHTELIAAVGAHFRLSGPGPLHRRRRGVSDYPPAPVAGAGVGMTAPGGAWLRAALSPAVWVDRALSFARSALYSAVFARISA